jgi:hypothetical protein
MNVSEEIICGNKRPLLLWLSAVSCFILAVTLSPPRLVILGIMAESITSNIELVRKTTLIEIHIVRLALACMGGLLSGLLWRWESFAQSALAKAIRNHPTRFYKKDQANSVLNGSLALMVLAVIATLAYIGLAKAHLKPTTLSLIGGEDGIVESLSAFLFLGSAIASAAMIRTVKNAPARRAVLMVLVVGFVFCFGEEISWAQRMIGFSTPELIGEANVQNEANLHNLLGYFADHLFYLTMLTYGILFPLLQRCYPSWRAIFSMLGLPLPSLGLATGIALAALLHKRIIWRIIPTSSGILVGEFRETIMSLALLLMMLEYHHLLLRVRNEE